MATALSLKGTHLAHDYLNCEFRMTFGIELQAKTLDWNNKRLKGITEEMTVMEQLKNLIFDANGTCKFVFHDGIQYVQDFKTLLASPDSHKVKDINVSIAVLDDMKQRKSKSTWHSKDPADFDLCIHFRRCKESSHLCRCILVDASHHHHCYDCSHGGINN
jgi:hypothetical protein